MGREEIEEDLEYLDRVNMDPTILDALLKTSKRLEGEHVTKAFPYILAAGFTALLERLEKG